ncbi:hypothetical protein MmiEs2_16550 [Methanimicrococcus stummii]|uniref:Uncharacterized protein n=1 Tax=Methanimicrococcus stummii TaxID=3028294 RepID=A0AA96VBM7_9EURY|nr:hypothetical protein MmiEs2_16550 [Methanimicrococcus sp. Es2]
MRKNIFPVVCCNCISVNTIVIQIRFVTANNNDCMIIGICLISQKLNRKCIAFIINFKHGSAVTLHNDITVFAFIECKTQFILITERGDMNSGIKTDFFTCCCRVFAGPENIISAGDCQTFNQIRNGVRRLLGRAPFRI